LTPTSNASRPVNPRILRAELVEFFGSFLIPKVRVAETACPPRYLCRFQPQNPGIYSLSLWVSGNSSAKSWLFLYFAHTPRREENRRDRFEHRGSQLSMFVRSFSPFPTSTGAELHGECTTVECRPPRMSLCFQAIDRFCSTFALIIISKKRHKSRRYGGRWCAGIGAALSRRSSFCLKTERGNLKARIG